MNDEETMRTNLNEITNELGIKVVIVMHKLASRKIISVVL